MKEFFSLLFHLSDIIGDPWLSVVTRVKGFHRGNLVKNCSSASTRPEIEETVLGILSEETRFSLYISAMNQGTSSGSCVRSRKFRSESSDIARGERLPVIRVILAVCWMSLGDVVADRSRLVASSGAGTTNDVALSRPTGEVTR